MAGKIGRPAGSGVSDGATLTKIADMLVAGQVRTANAAIMKIYKKDLVKEPLENFRRRIHRKWKEQRIERMAEARMKYNERYGTRLNLTKSVGEWSLRESAFEGLTPLPSNSPISTALLMSKKLEVVYPNHLRELVDRVNETNRQVMAPVRQLHETIERISVPALPIQELVERITAPWNNIGLIRLWNVAPLTRGLDGTGRDVPIE